MLAKLTKLINSLLWLFPPYRKKKEMEEYKRQERLKRHERYRRSKGCRFKFVGRWTIRNISKHGDDFSFLVATDSKRMEYYHYRLQLGAPPLRKSGYFVYDYSERDEINERRFFRLLEIIDEFQGTEILVEGATNLCDIIEDNEDILAPRFYLVNPETKEKNLIIF